MRLVFLGTPDAAVPSLRALVEAGHDIELVITRPDRRRGRGTQLSSSPVKSAALELGLSVGHRIADLDHVEVERGVVVAYGAMIPASVLERVPMLNVHFSLLPRWRGAAPVERAILAGDEVTGVSVISLEASLDTGPVHAERRTDVDAKSANDLTRELATLGATLLVQVLGSKELLASPVAQSGEPTYAEKLTGETFHLLPSMPVVQLERTVRLGRAFTLINGRRTKILSAHITDAPGVAGTIAQFSGEVALVGVGGALVLERVQPEGSRPMDAKDWWSGVRLDASRAEWA
ncbi:MAG: methionyl-tRNA formyltransferase [Acidobacteria bacterium]|nr:methionyl-tRNA formyltransferase [Acidobacteriota bacterium]